MQAQYTRLRDIAIATGLIVAVLAVYGQTLSFEYLNYDDNLYVTGCAHTKGGLSWDSVGWAFMTGTASNWHPLTWLSFMLDISVFGETPGPMHAVNVLLHAVNGVLLFLLLRAMTGAVGRSAFVAALFALHPLHIESVAWIAERKDVLSTCFWFLTTLAYVRYVRRPGLARYGLVLLAYALGLLTKPMLVTLPATLLLLDIWPLGRWGGMGYGVWGMGFATPQFLTPKPQTPYPIPHLFLEKAPLFVLAVASSVATVIAQYGGKSMTTLDVLPVAQRVANAALVYVQYLLMMVWPSHLAPFYPHPGPSISYLLAGFCALLLVAVTIAVFAGLRRWPYLAVGWLWYLGTLLPVIGIVQVGAQAMADRYTYVPLIGVFIVIAWGCHDLAAAKRVAGLDWALSGVSVLIVLVFGVVSIVQTQYWHDSTSLFRHALRVTRNNHLAHKNLGVALADKKRPKEAMEEYLKAVKIKPNDPDLYYNMGNAMDDLKRPDDAVKNYLKAIEISPEHVNSLYNLANTYARLERYDDAATQYKKTLERDPNHSGALVNMGNTMAMTKRLDEAAYYYQRALQIEPNNQESLANLGNVFAEQGKTDEALAYYRKAIQNDPRDTQSYANMARTLIATGRTAEAIQALETVIRLNPSDTGARQSLNKLRGLATPTSTPAK